MYGTLSLIVWSLIVIVSVKYALLILRLDNRGEGGILALLALLRLTRRREGAPRRAAFVTLGIFGAALLYGDGVITPAISVLSAVEGLEVIAPDLEPYVVPVTVVILFLLFALQRRGTARVGAIFGPIMLVWFVAIAALGAVQIVRQPAILLALNPWYGVRFLAGHGTTGFLALGAVVLAVTGAEALYADLGHFGRRPIRLAWFALVLPALLLNYLGQGALVLGNPETVRNPFYHLAAPVLLAPLVVLATLATIIASQALISGVFSLAQQSIQLQLSPRVSIVHTSPSEPGQVYVPAMNAALMVGCLLLVLGFRSSSALSAAYGLAVTGTMSITTLLFYAVARDRWGWSRWRAGLVAGGFLIIDLTFLAANLVKVRQGGWVPVALAGAIFFLMTTWRRGSDLVTRRMAEAAEPLDHFIAEVARARPPRVPGTAVFLTANVEGAPLVLQHHLRHNKALHERVVLLSIVAEELPAVDDGDRLQVEALTQGFSRVRAHYGFMETANVQQIVERCCRAGVGGELEDTTYYLGRAHLLASGRGRMAAWRKRLFAFMARNSSSVSDFFNIPPQRVVEVGRLPGDLTSSGEATPRLRPRCSRRPRAGRRR